MKLSQSFIRTLTRKIASKLSQDSHIRANKIQKTIQNSKNLKELNLLLEKQKELIDKLEQSFNTSEIDIYLELDSKLNMFIVRAQPKRLIKRYQIEDEILLLTEIEPTNLTSEEIIDSVVNKLKPQ